MTDGDSEAMTWLEFVQHKMAVAEAATDWRMTETPA
jgi:hypothetical protein